MQTVRCTNMDDIDIAVNDELRGGTRRSLGVQTLSSRLRTLNCRVCNTSNPTTSSSHSCGVDATHEPRTDDSAPDLTDPIRARHSVSTKTPRH
jgi:hypothetical protein